MKYGDLPKVISTNLQVDCKEMLFYQYLPIKLSNSSNIKYEKRLSVFDTLINNCILDFNKTLNSFKEFEEYYIYLTVKHMYQLKNSSYNRTGYHSDGFLTNDINYIWSNINPTVFNISDFDLTLDDKLSLIEMKDQANPQFDIMFANNTLLKLDQYNIHKVNDKIKEGMRTFFKLSFSKDKYDLIGNSHNYELDYNWEMKERQKERNIPQTKIQD